ncbi:MAG: glycosyltransferase family 2 protein [Candidatus Mucispirillum faecigallinarum]|nr:glycosyltransferase family 2 protein [Candidatus Mucispirillum faecigallinarum]
MISIIIPLHNLGKNGDYCLKKCLDSIIAQTYTDFEVLLMENGSTDDTVDVAKEYCMQDNRFKLFILEKIGVSNARNHGISAAAGEYITFVDGDDYISEDFLESASSLFLSSDVDIIFLPWSFYYQNNNKVKNILSFSSSKVIERPKEDNKKITSFVCAKIIKSSIIKNSLLFSTDMVTAEDSLFMTEAYFKAKKIGFVHHGGGYYYTQNRKGQTTIKISIKKVNNLYSLIEKYRVIYKNYNVLNENEKILENLTVSFFVGDKFSQTDISKLSLSDLKSFLLQHKDEIIKLNIDEFNCKKWQKVWLKRIQYFTLKNKAHYFIKFMRIYRNILPKFLRKKFYD